MPQDLPQWRHNPDQPTDFGPQFSYTHTNHHAQSESMNPQLLSELADAVNRMPAFPKSVQKVLELAQDERSTPRDLVLVIDKDPVLTVRMLKIVNSAYYRLPKRISSIGQAVVYLGFNATKNLALGMAAIGMLPTSSNDGFDWHAYLVHSLTTAAIAKQLATKSQAADALDCFVAGLLHDFGKVVFARTMPTQFAHALQLCARDQSSLHLAMRETMGADHTVTGAMLLERWRFAPDLVDTVRNQFGSPVQDSGSIACVFAANQISKKLKLGFAGNPFVSDLPAPLAARLGGDLDSLIAGLDDLTALHEETKLFARI